MKLKWGTSWASGAWADGTWGVSEAVQALKRFFIAPTASRLGGMWRGRS